MVRYNYMTHSGAVGNYMTYSGVVSNYMTHSGVVSNYMTYSVAASVFCMPLLSHAKGLGAFPVAQHFLLRTVSPQVENFPRLLPSLSYVTSFPSLSPLPSYLLFSSFASLPSLSLSFLPPSLPCPSFLHSPVLFPPSSTSYRMVQ